MFSLLPEKLEPRHICATDFAERRWTWDSPLCVAPEVRRRRRSSKVREAADSPW